MHRAERKLTQHRWVASMSRLPIQFRREVSLRITSFIILFAPFSMIFAQAQAGTQQQSAETKRWENSIYISAGPAIAYVNRNDVQDTGIKLDFVNSGFGVGKILTNNRGLSLARGQFEYVAEVEPFWLADSLLR